jgi:hypothetical protein
MLTRSINTRRVTAVVLACGTALSLMAVDGIAATKTTKSARKTVTVLQKQTKTINVRYPEALKHSGAEYSCAFKVSGPAKRKVKILSHGSALGGTVCRVKAKNTSKVSGLDGTASIKVTATTRF